MSRETPPHDLGDAPVENADSLSLPDTLVDAGVLAPGSEAYWAYDPSTDRLVVTKSRRALDENPSYTPVGTTEVSEDGSVSLPAGLVGDTDGEPWDGTFEVGDRCHFDATDALLAEGLCWVLTDDQHRTLWNE